MPEVLPQITFSKSELKCYESARSPEKFKYSPEMEMRVKIGKLLSERIYEMIGLTEKNHPTPAGAKDISYFIFHRYPDFTLFDLYNAFEYALAEITAPEKGKKDEDWLNHFQCFSIKYFTPILNSYRKYKTSSVDKIIKKLNNYNESRQFIDIRKKNDWGIKTNILRMYQYYLDGNSGMIFTTTNEYYYLDDLNLIESTNDQKRDYLKFAKAQIFQQAKGTKEFKVSDWAQKSKRSIYASAQMRCILQLFEELSSYGLQKDNLELVLNNACFIDHESHYKLKFLKENGTI